MTVFKKIFLLLAVILFPVFTLAQGDIEDLLYTEVDNLNPVYKPVVGFGIGTFNYLGDIKNPNQNPLMGTRGFHINVATFIDNYGWLSGDQRSYSNPAENMNFWSEILVFGLNLNYDFDNFYKTYRRVHPYVSLGFETMSFKSKTDLYTMVEDVPVYYNYWADGTIRNYPYSADVLTNPSLQIIERDNPYDPKSYETNLRDIGWGLDEYPQYAFALPVEVGLDFWVSNRVLFRIGTSYHLVFSDLIDHVSNQNTTGLTGNASKNDSYLYTYCSMHLDLFSSKKTLAVQKLFADLELDLTLIGDDDNDGYMDGWDQCPNTPFGVATDTTGCPMDEDYDGVPDYMDDEPYSRYGAFVDNRGVEISEAKLIASLDMSNAVRREDIELYLRTPSSYSNYKNLTTEEIPGKFIKVDSDKDGYISFDEVMKEIDNFFDFNSNLNSQDIYELNNFFFAQ
jgi:hypothetical protein